MKENKEKSLKSRWMSIVNCQLSILFLSILSLVIVIASIHRYILGLDHIKNFLIFKTSFFNLINYHDLYGSQSYQGIDLDYYKYSPVFALIFSPIAAMPVILGVIIWNLINSLLLFFAIKSLPFNNTKKAIIFWLVFIEMLTSIQNCQSNALIAALMIFTFTAFENRNLLFAAFCIVLSTYIKLFGIVAIIMFLFYPGRIRFILYTVMWSAILFFLPLLTISFEQLIFLYKSWFALLANDQSISWGFSVMGILKSWFGIETNKLYIQLIGAIILCLPMLNIKSWSKPIFRILYLASIMIWVIIFNHKAESPTFIIALCGMAIWFVSEDIKPFSLILIIFALMLTSLSPTDIFPKYIRVNYVIPYSLKALPALLIWIVIQYKLFLFSFQLNSKQNNAI